MAAVEKPKRRPAAKYSRALAIQICEYIANGVTLSEIGDTPGMPDRVTIIRWANRDVDGFADRYIRAKQIYLTLMEDEIREIADDRRNDWMERLNKRTGEVSIVFNKEHVSRSIARIEVRKFLLARLVEKFAARVAIKLQGDKAVRPDMSPVEAASAYAALIKGEDSDEH